MKSNDFGSHGVLYSYDPMQDSIQIRDYLIIRGSLVVQKELTSKSQTVISYLRVRHEFGSGSKLNSIPKYGRLNSALKLQNCRQR